MEKLVVERSVWIAAPRQRVWRAITDAEQLSHWYRARWEIPALEVGTPIRFGVDGAALLAAIAVVDPPCVLALYWPPQSQDHSISMFTRYKLEKENGGTRVIVTETGFGELSDAVRQEWADGNATVLENMKAFLEGASAEMKTPGNKVYAAVDCR